MDFNDFDFNNFNFNDFINYIQNSENTSNCDWNCENQQFNSNTESNNTNTNCNDIPGGFQNLNPQVFITLGQLLGNIMSANLPFNVQNALGNWLQLVGQTILTFNSQQQYFQGGPGRYYNLKYKNVANPFCPTPTSQTDTNQTSDSYENISTNTSSSKSLNKYESEIKNLKNSIEELRKEITELKNNK
ncbi:hypothetical protein FDE76_09190 [Clostridium botulinum]|uniref:Uncharacterized protein n=1 Tax=Clostridium botulinum (strain Eklund 17B / Type B) TaxID=935198 RepID=B2TPH0_CLOBB|nr:MULTISPECIES: hypothetical protein [unclassified Clostridium]ACD22410.1 conserved hypothetical protein [Clostridium botulinum B str. Eklund 17B (NRP)]MBN1053068.1 hypothetical protein [Clostridium botulinum]MBN1056275.1 hypothetical protein [Clostridium botulinum]MBY6975311.1 hypothetical protein [Clostridium botulinum]MBY7000860.1 hypothetical protein [Clostridium botulinum]